MRRFEHLLGVRGRPGEVVDRERDLEHRVAVRLAGLLVDDVGELRHPAGDHALPGLQVRLALVEAEARPPVGLLAGARDRVADLLGACATGWSPTTSPVAGLSDSNVVGVLVAGWVGHWWFLTVGS